MILKNIRIFGLVLILTFIVISCEKSNYYIYSPDRLQCITVKDFENIRYIIPGKRNSIPKTGYVKLDMSEVDPLGDGLYGCWNSNNFEWEIATDGGIVLENNLDRNKYKFSAELPKDDDGVPTAIKYSSENCFTFDISLNRLSPNKGAVVE